MVGRSPSRSTPTGGALTLYMGSNQMWGLRKYNRCMFGPRRHARHASKPGSSPRQEGNEEASEPPCVEFQSDTTFPRRLGLGGLTISPTNISILAGATFTAEMHIATAEVRASLTSPVTGACLSVHVVLDPDENIALATITSTPTMEVLLYASSMRYFVSGLLPVAPFLRVAHTAIIYFPGSFNATVDDPA